MSKFSFEKDFSRHPLHYFTLLSIELVGLWGIFWFTYQPSVQLGILIAMSLSYVAWGVVHHYQHRDLHFTVIMDYILISMLAILIFGSLLIRS